MLWRTAQEMDPMRRVIRQEAPVVAAVAFLLAFTFLELAGRYIRNADRSPVAASSWADTATPASGSGTPPSALFLLH